MKTINANMSIHNRFDIEVVDSRTGEIKQKAKAENVILDKWWANMGLYSNFYRIAYGSGTGTPAASDTDLFHREAVYQFATGGWTQSLDTANGVAYRRAKCIITETQEVGKTFSEVGLVDNNNFYATTHAMLEDMNGNPVTIVKTDTDIFNIYATVYFHWTQKDIFHLPIWYSNTILDLMTGGTVSNSIYKNTGFRKGVGSVYVNGYINAVVSYDGYRWALTFDRENKQITFTSQRYGVNDVNMSGIKYISVGEYVQGPWIILDVEDFYSGDDIIGEAIGTGDGSTTRFNTAFDFPEDADIYVNGVKQTSGVTVRKIGQSKAPWYISTFHKDSTASNKMFDMTNEMRWESTSAENFSILPCIFRNESGIGFAEVRMPTSKTDNIYYHSYLYGSNDMSSWTLIHETSDYSGSSQRSQETVTLDSTTGYYKYYKYVYNDTGVPSIWDRVLGITPVSDDRKTIIFDTAPANGAVITADYHTACIAKDTDHVLDMTFVLNYGPYSE